MTAYYGKDGKVAYYGPPFTEEEELELYRQMAGIKPDGTWAGGFKVVHSTPPAAPPTPPQKSPPPSPEGSRQPSAQPQADRPSSAPRR